MNIIWCTESVDNSAMFASQAMDATLTKEKLNDPEDFSELVQELKDPDNKLLFYGIVKLPEWFEEIYDRDRMFNDPRKCRAFLNRKSTLDTLGAMGVSAAHYVFVEDKSWSQVREELHTSTVDLLKGNATKIATVTSSSGFNEHVSNGQVRYACKHIEAVSKFRLFAGVDHLTSGGLICVTCSFKKKLSYKETLMHGQSGDVKSALESLFEEGLIEEVPDKCVEAWTEESTVPAEHFEDSLTDTFKDISKKVIGHYGADFCAIDVVETDNGTLMVTNVTSCPSIQESEVLSPVSAYLVELLSIGRVITKEIIIESISDLSENEVAKIGKMLKELNVLKTANAG